MKTLKQLICKFGIHTTKIKSNQSWVDYNDASGNPTIKKYSSCDTCGTFIK